MFEQLYQAAFSTAHRELGNRSVAIEITHATLARAHARWSVIGPSPISWLCAVARTQASQALAHLPAGPEVLVEDEPGAGSIPGADPRELAAVVRRGTWLRRRQLAGRIAAGLCVLAAAGLVLGLGRALPQVPRERTAPTVSAAANGLLPIPARPWTEPGLTFGLISAGRSEQGSIRVTFEPHTYDRSARPRIGVQPDGPAEQLVIDPQAVLLARDHQVEQPPGRPGLVSWTPEDLIRNLNRFTPGGRTYVWLRLGPDGRISSLREA